MNAGGAIPQIQEGPKGAERGVKRKGAWGKRRGIFVVSRGMQDGAIIHRDGIHIHVAMRKFRTQRAPASPANVALNHLPANAEATT